MNIDHVPASLPTSAGFHLVRNVPTVGLEFTCGEALMLLRRQRFEYAEAFMILDDARRLRGLLPTGELASHEAGVPVHQVMRRDFPVALADTDQEHVASLAIAGGLAMVPVVGADGEFLGLVAPPTLLAVLRREHLEDLDRLTGISRETSVARSALEGPLVGRMRHRLPWLLVGLAGSSLAALVMARFEVLLREHIAVAFFLPSIVYLADAIGTQTEAISVRALSFGHARISTLLSGEIRTGLMIGAILGTIATLLLWIFMHDLRFALAVGVALLTASGLATGIGLVLPWLFHRLGFDPAYGSGPLATVLQDVLTILSYLSCMVAFLGLPTDIDAGQP